MLNKNYSKLRRIIDNEVGVIKTEFNSLNKNYNEITTQNKNFLDNLHYAQIIQSAILPKQRHLDRLFEDSFSIYDPKSIIGGDFFWCSENEHYTFLALGDCTGHGVPGAMLATLGTSLLNYAILNKGLTRSYEILKEIDKRFIESFTSDGEYLNNNDWLELGLIVYNKKNRSIDFSGAKTPLFIARGNKVIEFKGNKFPIGGWQIEKNRNYTSEIIPIRNEDFIYLTSDGYIDQFGGMNNKRFTKNKLKLLFLSNYYKSGKEQRHLFKSKFNDWKGMNEQTDDVCLVGVKFSEQDV